MKTKDQQMLEEAYASVGKPLLVGVLYSNDEIEVTELTQDFKAQIENARETYEYKGATMYMYEDVVLCVGRDENKIRELLKSFNEDPKVKEFYNMAEELEITFHTRYNGWTISNDDKELEDKLASYGLTFYDEDGDINDYPSKEDVSVIVNKHYNKPTNFEYIVNETDS